MEADEPLFAVREVGSYDEEMRSAYRDVHEYYEEECEVIAKLGSSDDVWKFMGSLAGPWAKGKLFLLECLRCEDKHRWNSLWELIMDDGFAWESTNELVWGAAVTSYCEHLLTPDGKEWPEKNWQPDSPGVFDNTYFRFDPSRNRHAFGNPIKQAKHENRLKEMREAAKTASNDWEEFRNEAAELAARFGNFDVVKRAIEGDEASQEHMDFVYAELHETEALLKEAFSYHCECNRLKSYLLGHEGRDFTQPYTTWVAIPKRASATALSFLMHAMGWEDDDPRRKRTHKRTAQDEVIFVTWHSGLWVRESAELLKLACKSLLNHTRREYSIARLKAENAMIRSRHLN